MKKFFLYLFWVSFCFLYFVYFNDISKIIGIYPAMALFFALPTIATILFPKERSTKKKKTKNKKKPAKKKSVAPKQKKLSDAELLDAPVDSLSGTDFERLMEMYYKDKGYEVQRVGGSGDHEVDLILKGKEGYKIAVQCKRRKDNIGNDTVLRLKAGKQVHNCLDAWIVTTSHFTRSAQEAAKSLNITLINGAMVSDMLHRWKKEKKKKAQ